MAVNLVLGSWVNVASTASGNGSGTIYYDVYLKSQSIANNTSTIDVRLRHAITTGSGWQCYQRTFSGTHLTTVSSSDFYQNGAYNGVYNPTYTTGSNVVVTHGSDGSKSESITATVAFTSIGQTYNLSGSMTFPTIARASKPTPSASNVNVNGSNSITINTNRASSSFTHTIAYKIGSTTLRTASSIGASDTYTIPLSAFSTVTGAKTATVTVTCTTYSGTTQIGSAQTTSFTITAVEANFKPTISSPSCTEGNSNTGVSGWNTVRYLSSKTVTVNATTVQGATANVYVVVSGTRYKMTLQSGTTYRVVLSNIKGGTSSTITYKFEVTDSRGFTASTGNYSGTFYLYEYPQITSLQISRTNSTATTGTLVISGSYYRATAPKTSTSIYYAYKSGSAPADSAVTTAASTSTKNFSITVNLTGLITTSQFTYYAKIKDAFNQYASTSVVLGVSTGSLWVGKETVRVIDEIVEKRLAILNSSGSLNGYLDGTKFGQLLYNSSGVKQLNTGANITLATANVPNLAASKITSGTFDVARIPNLTAAKISGTFTRTENSFKFPDGTMIQWGSLSVPNNSTQTKSFTTAFGTECLAMWATSNQVGFGAVSTVAVKATSKSQFQISQYNPAGANMTIEWFAIGY